MAGSSAVKVEYCLVSLKSVLQVIPGKDREKEMLVEDLTRMGCEGLLLEPWALKSKAMIHEF